jgi:hypothetical protein
LRQEDLVVFGADAGHHDAKNVHEAADQQQPSRAISIVDEADKHPLCNDQSRSATLLLQRTPPMMKKICKPAIHEMALGEKVLRRLF